MITADRSFENNFTSDLLIQALACSPAPTDLYSGEDIIIHFANQGMLELWGKDASVIGKLLMEALPELEGQPFLGLLQQVWCSGKTYAVSEAPAKLIKNGVETLDYFDYEYRALLDENQKTWCILNTALNVTSRREFLEQFRVKEEREQALNEEMAATLEELTYSNEALQITGLLLKNKIPAKLIQTNDNFSLYNLAEVRFFLDRLNLYSDAFTVSDEVWDSAKQEVKNKFHSSNKLEICINIIKEFEATNTKRKYKSDLDAFIRESKLEDFFNTNGETVFVSTIHKSKGREFDNVFMLLENFSLSTDEAKRQLYVAMTRAKNNLTIHTDATFLDHFFIENLTRTQNKETYSQPDELAMHLTYQDVYLDFFLNSQHLISWLTCGDLLIFYGNICMNSCHQPVLQFSQRFIEKIETLKKQSYELKTVKVNFIVYWMKENTNQEIKIILPEVCFKKIGPSTVG